MTNRKIEDIDKNLKVETSLSVEDICFHDVRKDPFDLYGLYRAKEEPVFKRMPDNVATATSEGVERLAKNTAGGRVRFTTDSSYIAIKCAMPSITRFPHMTLTGTTGFDLYIDKNGKGIYAGTFMPPVDIQDGYESIFHFPDRASRSVTIHFPLYNEVSELHIGLQKDAALDHGAKYTYEKPVLYYGSSITQGGCASRPGNSYENIVSAKLDCDHINLGFSGSARGEDAIVDYMATLDFSIFVSDYDYNAPSVEHLRDTHEKMFLEIRRTHPATPVVFMSRPNFDIDVEQSVIRRDIIYQTFMNAQANGDRNVFFLDGECLFKDENRDACTVDGCHPNDAGFVRMAEAVARVMDSILRRTSV